MIHFFRLGSKQDMADGSKPVKWDPKLDEKTPEEVAQCNILLLNNLYHYGLYSKDRLIYFSFLTAFILK